MSLVRILKSGFMLISSNVLFLNCAFSETLSLNEMLVNLNKHPMVEAYEAKIRQRDAEILISEGAFDTSVNIETYNRASGFYDGKYSKFALNKPIRDIGGYIEGGYRIGNEDFPVYEQDLKTLNGGEMFLSLTVPVLRNLFIDPQRAMLLEKTIAAQVANEDIKNFRLKLYAQAAKAYWNWVEKGNTLQIVRSIAEIAKVRLEQLDKRSKLGDLPELDAIDANRALMKRKADETKAQQEYIASSNTLSLYLRDQSGNPVELTNYKVHKPSGLKCNEISSKEKLLKTAFDNRPELKVLELQIQQIEVSLKQAMNELLPKLDLKVTGQEDVGSGEDSLDQAELKVGALFSVPLERRVARGKISKAEQALVELKSNRRYLQDQLTVEVSVFYENYMRICEQIGYAENEALTSNEVAEGERKKFNQGDSSLVIVNLREQDVAEASIRVIKAKTDLHAAMAEITSAQGIEMIR